MKTVRRAELRTFLDAITRDPELIFAVTCRRRTDVFLRYEPPDMERQGNLAYVGDHSVSSTRQFVTAGRGGQKILLQPAGSIRHMLCKRKMNVAPMKHWRSKGGNLRFDPVEKGLFGPVVGMYNDSLKIQPNDERRIGRFGQWRPWQFLALEGITSIQCRGETFVVVD